MSFIYANPNPANATVGDCVIRAISILTRTSWTETYDNICRRGRSMRDMPASNAVWSSYLTLLGYKRYIIPNTCPFCYSIRMFTEDHPYGRYLLATGSHVVAVIDGNYYDTWDSGNEIPIYYWKKEE